MMDEVDLSLLASGIEPTIEPVEPPPELRSRLMAAIAAGPLAVVLADEGQWLPLGPPGVERRMLYRDAVTGQRTYQLRMAPGSVLPAHRHKSNEQCLVLQGDIEWEGHRYGAGDFLVASTAHEHTPVTSEKGALILIVGG